MFDRRRWLLIGWLVVVFAGHVAAFIAVRKFFVYTRHGQLLDSIAFTGNTIGRSHLERLVDPVLNVISTLALAAATAVAAFVALIRRRVALALAVGVLVAGANISTQLLKYGSSRPDLGLNGALAQYGNTLPSGHTTVAASVAVAVILVLPPQLRRLGGLLGAGYAALIGVSTLSAGWHRPSDAVAGILVVGAWAAFASILLVLLTGRRHAVASRDAHPVQLGVLVGAGVALLLAGLAGLYLTDQVVEIPAAQLSKPRLFVAYAGSAAGVAGAASLMIAVVLATVHQVVPRRSKRRVEDDWAATELSTQEAW